MTVSAVITDIRLLKNGYMIDATPMKNSKAASKRGHILLPCFNFKMEHVLSRGFPKGSLRIKKTEPFGKPTDAAYHRIGGSYVFSQKVRLKKISVDIISPQHVFSSCKQQTELRQVQLYLHQLL